MRSINIAELKNHLNVYLDEVQAGHEVLIYHRQRPIAKLVPVERPEEFDKELLALAAAGKARLPEAPLPESFWEMPAPEVSAKNTLTLCAPIVMKTKAAFWDTSALIPPFCQQSNSAPARQWARVHRPLVVWWGTYVESFNTIARLRREGALTQAHFDQAYQRLQVLRRSWVEIAPTSQIFDLAEKVLLPYSLSSADGLQLNRSTTTLEHVGRTLVCPGAGDRLKSVPRRLCSDLAAALAWCSEQPRRRIFVCADQKLSQAAKQIGFDLRFLPA